MQQEGRCVSTFLEHPEEIYNNIERLMYEDLASQTLGPGQQPLGLNARAWVEFRSRITSYKTGAHCAWCFAGILDAMVAGRYDLARARACLGLLQLDQAAIDRGNWTLAAELSLEQSPPMTALASHEGPNVQDGESPFFTAPGCEVGRSDPWTPARPRRVCHEAEEHRQAEQQEQGGQRGVFFLGKQAETKGQAEGQGKYSGREGRGCLSSRDEGGSGTVPPLNEGLKLPGAGAATISVPGFLNSLPRLLLKTKGSLRGFLRSIVQNPADEMSCTSTPGGITTWPCPLPYPEVFKRGACSHVPDAHLKRLVCLQVAVLNWLMLGRAEVAPTSLRLGTRLTARQWTAVKMLEHLAVDRNFAEFVSATDMGRSASKVEDLQDCIDVLARAAVALHCERGGYFFLKPSKTGASEGILPLRAGQFEGRLDKDPVVTAKP